MEQGRFHFVRCASTVKCVGVGWDWRSRFLQGPATDRAEVAKLKAAIMSGESYCGRLFNYRKDGSTFWNLLTISPVKDDAGTVVKFIG